VVVVDTHGFAEKLIDLGLGNFDCPQRLADFTEQGKSIAIGADERTSISGWLISSPRPVGHNMPGLGIIVRPARQ